MLSRNRASITLIRSAISLLIIMSGVMLNGLRVTESVYSKAQGETASASVKADATKLTPVRVARPNFYLISLSHPTTIASGWNLTTDEFDRINLHRISSRAGYQQQYVETNPTETRSAAEKLCAEAKQLIGESKSESSRLAISKYNQALSLWRMVGDARKEADTLVEAGSIHQVLGELHQSLTQYNHALNIYRKLHDRWKEGEALNEIGFVYSILCENDKAFDLCLKALNLNRTTGNHQAEARALNNLGDAYYNIGKLKLSLESYNKALAIWRESSNQHGQALALLNIGYVHSDLGEMQKAFYCFNQALSIWQGENNRRWEGVTLTAMGRLYTRLGESQEALNCFTEAKEIIEPMGDQIEMGRILSGIAYVYYLLDEKQQALDYYDQALGFYKNASYLCAQGNMIDAIGNVHYSMGDYDKAIEYFEQNLSLSRAINDRREQSNCLRGIGSVYEARGDKLKALDYYSRALPFYQSEHDLRAEADTLRTIGQLHYGLGQRQKALYYYGKALSRSREAEYRFGETSTLYVIAQSERELGKLAEARTQIETAIDVVESLRTKVISQNLRTSYFASVRQYYEFYISLLMQLHIQDPAAGFDIAAFDASERVRARSLFESLTEARVGLHQQVDPALLERERVLRQELNDKAAQRRYMLDDESANEKIPVIDKEMDDAARQLRELEAQIRAASLDYAASMQQPLKLEMIQEQAIDDDTLLLEYSLGEAKSYLWAVTKTSLSSYELPGRAEIETLANRVRNEITAYQFREGESFDERQARLRQAEIHYQQDARLLSDMLIRPLSAQLGQKRLIIIADGALQYMSFGALPVPDSPDCAPLMLEHEITCQPSASTLAVLRTKNRERQPSAKILCMFADPVFEQDDPRLKKATRPVVEDARGQSPDMEVRKALRDAGTLQQGRQIPRLFASRDEAEAAFTMVPPDFGMKALGFDANKMAATSPALKEFSIIHFATHGILDDENPDLSGLVLSLFDKSGQPQDGFLRLYDVYNMELPADLVVLSACNTGVGKQVKGEGLIGLSRGFMYAGASRVMASLWKVDDEATSELIKSFYQEVLKQKKTPAEALRQAQIRMWRQERWRAPYFWAAFILQGEYTGEIRVKENAPASLLKVGKAAAVFAILLIVCYMVSYIAIRKYLNGFDQ